MTIKTRIIRIGNSQGIRIPKPLLEQSGIKDEVELEVEDQKIVIHAAARPRRTWDEAFGRMAAQRDDELLDAAPPGTEWDEEEWEW